MFSARKNREKQLMLREHNKRQKVMETLAISILTSINITALSTPLSTLPDEKFGAAAYFYLHP
jgi:hypothetical protein